MSANQIGRGWFALDEFAVTAAQYVPPTEKVQIHTGSRATNDATAYVFAESLSIVRPDWWDDAACRGLGTRLFFPERGEDHKQAKAVCVGCDVVETCRDEGMAEKFGIRGGLSERQRRDRRKQ